MNENVKCWNPCGQKGGSCSFCGYDGACCRQGWTDGAGCTGTNGCNGNHCCVEKKKIGALMNENVKCWNPCGQKGGSCSFCGYDGACCRQGWRWMDGAGCTGTNGCNG